MSTPARRHFERVMAAKAAATAGASDMHGEAFDLVMAQLHEDSRRLKGIQSIERKIEIKREILPNYAAYIAGVLEAGQGAQDDALMRLFVWRIDANDFAGALEIARYALAHGLTPPDSYARGTAAILAEQFAEAALAPSGSRPAIAQLEQVEQLIADVDMHDEIRAKLAKAMGRAYRDAEQWEPARQQFARALDLNERAGVKQELAAVERQMGRQQTEQPNRVDTGKTGDG